jgi:predicted DNA binding CopG/RHH family protein
MAKRQTIGDNPLDAYISTNTGRNEFEEKQDINPQKTAKQSKKQRITVQISVDVIERIKNAVYWTPGLTLAALAEEAFSKVVDKIEEERGEVFSKRREELKTGRPLN